MTAQVHAEIENLFRKQSSRIVARLVRLFGTRNIDLAENVVQEALISAMQTWPTRGIPENPAAWITTVAKNKALDALRRDKFLCQDAQAMEFPINASEEKLENEYLEDELKMLFMCCHPCLTLEVQVALALKSACGFGVSEIARAFFAKEEAIAQRIVRAKQKIRSEQVEFVLPALNELKTRLDMVLQALYLMFSEGYAATSGEELIRRDVCSEAIRLCSLLLKHKAGQSPDVHALLALMCLQSSRFDCRVDAQGNIILLEDQDRSRWDHDLISAGFMHLDLSSEADYLSSYHIEAGIAATHAAAPSFAETNWEHIVSYYDLLLDHKPSAVVRLNRAVAIGIHRGAQAGLRELKKLIMVPEFSTSMQFPAALADFHRRLGQKREARKYYEQALELVKTTTEKKFLEKRIQELK